MNNMKYKAPIAYILCAILLCIICLLVGYIIGQHSSKQTGEAISNGSLIANESPTDTPADTPEPTSQVTSQPLPYARPATGIVGTPPQNGASLLSISADSSGDYFVYIYYSSVPNADWLSTLHAMTRVYVRGGSTIGINVPLGIASIYYTVGHEWFGNDKLFGDNAQYFAYTNAFDFSNNQYTLNLSPSSDNVKTIKADEFPTYGVESSKF